MADKEVNFYTTQGKQTLFIDQKREHIPADAGFVKRKVMDVRYAEGSDKRMLDIYYPNEGEGPFPVIIDVFGGGWYFGARSSYKLNMALEFLKRGYAVVSVDYSLSWEAKYPTQIYELKAAIRYVKNHAKEYDFDTSRVALLGESAGAHGATLAAFSASCGMMEDIPFGEAGDARVNAVVVLYCPTDVTMTKYQFQVLGLQTWVPETGEANSPEGVLYGSKISDKEEEIRKSTVFNMITTDAPPTLFFHGTDDRVVPILQSQTFAAEIMRVAGIDKVEYHAIPGAGHVQTHFMTEENYSIIERFLDKHINKKGV